MLVTLAGQVQVVLVGALQTTTVARKVPVIHSATANKTKAKTMFL
jgi:hypothetical protein